MIAPKPFHFKQFSVDDSRCAMKVGTDAVMLGAWASAGNAGRILDIGTGCGLIALMTAQRSSGRIIALDIDKDATLQSKENFAASPWNDRIECIHTAVQQFYSESHFDLIICNPPFFKNALKTPDHQRNLARHNDTLSFESLLASVDRLLDQKGTFAFILPVDEAAELIRMASAHQLFLNRKCIVLSREDKSPNRILAEISRIESEIIVESLVIRDQKNQYTIQYKELTKEFYLFLTE